MSLTTHDFLLFLWYHKELLLDEEEATEHSFKLVNTLMDPVLQQEDVSEEKEAEAAGLKFSDHWVFWFDTSPPAQGVKQEDFIARLQELGKLGSVGVRALTLYALFDPLKEFCNEWNKLSKGDIFTMYSSLRLFKEGTKPVWEDPVNREGGKFWIVFPVDFEACQGAIPDEYVNLFLNLLIHMVCGQLGYEEDICGAGFTIRPYGLTITLWNKDRHFREQLEYISDRLKEIFPGVEPTYRDHSGVINYNYQMLSPSRKEGPKGSKIRQHRKGRTNKDGKPYKPKILNKPNKKPKDGKDGEKENKDGEKNNEVKPKAISVPKAPEVNPWSTRLSTSSEGATKSESEADGDDQGEWKTRKKKEPKAHQPHQQHRQQYQQHRQQHQQHQQHQQPQKQPREQPPQQQQQRPQQPQQRTFVVPASQQKPSADSSLKKSMSWADDDGEFNSDAILALMNTLAVPKTATAANTAAPAAESTPSEPEKPQVNIWAKRQEENEKKRKEQEEEDKKSEQEEKIRKEKEEKERQEKRKEREEKERNEKKEREERQKKERERKAQEKAKEKERKARAAEAKKQQQSGSYAQAAKKEPEVQSEKSKSNKNSNQSEMNQGEKPQNKPPNQNKNKGNQIQEPKLQSKEMKEVETSAPKETPQKEQPPKTQPLKSEQKLESEIASSQTSQEKEKIEDGWKTKKPRRQQNANKNKTEEVSDWGDITASREEVQKEEVKKVESEPKQIQAPETKAKKPKQAEQPKKEQQPQQKPQQQPQQPKQKKQLQKTAEKELGQAQEKPKANKKKSNSPPKQPKESAAKNINKTNAAETTTTAAVANKKLLFISIPLIVLLALIFGFLLSGERLNL